MPVGTQLSRSQVDATLTALAVRMRTLMQDVTNFSLTINGTGQGLAVLAAIGYSTDANPANPASMSDAAYALQLIAYLNTPAGVCNGTVQAGGSGGTGTAFNYNQALSALWAGQ
jgi:hypothetical protein